MIARPRSRPSGFTLIELVLAIVIVGILAAVASSKFIGLDSEARASSLNSLASAIATGSSINQASRAVGSGSSFAVDDADMCNAASLERFSQGPLPSGLSVSASGPASCSSAAVSAVACQLSMGAEQLTAWVQCANAGLGGATGANPGLIDAPTTPGGPIDSGDT
jgi:prepilin-type N-terminal cleavage/methylation domain-containing protein